MLRLHRPQLLGSLATPLPPPLSAPLSTPSISPRQESVHLAVASRPEQFVTAKEQGTAATEEMLDAVSAYYGLKAQ